MKVKHKWEAQWDRTLFENIASKYNLMGKNDLWPYNWEDTAQTWMDLDIGKKFFESSRKYFHNNNQSKDLDKFKIYCKKKP